VILVLTSNIGSQFLVDLSLPEAERYENVMALVRKSFKPEFLNRLDDIIMFDALTVEELGKIVAIQIQNLGKRLADRRITLQVTDAAVEWLSLNGFDPLYGARPLRRLIQTSIGDQLARRVLSGEIVDGSTVTVDCAVAGDTLSISASH
jgi:ATP-dependent Clp protease ATP-binding subunit ClpB